MNLLVIDIGNTRTKWALADGAGKLSATEVCLNADIASSGLNIAAQKANKAVIANVAGDIMARQIWPLLTSLEAQFIQAGKQACGVSNHYQSALGADRWAALVAAWHIHKRTTIVVNAGTAITIDALSEAGDFLGGTIMPGLRLMQESLSHNTARLNVAQGLRQDFPRNTQDAIETGCLNAAIGSIQLMLKQLETHAAKAPQVVVSGGDAHKLAQVLSINLKQVIMIENLVLQGLVLLRK